MYPQIAIAVEHTYPSISRTAALDLSLDFIQPVTYIINMLEIMTLHEAIKLNLPYFFTGRPCIRGHLSLRTASGGGCLMCRNEHAKKWKKSHPEFIRVRMGNVRARKKGNGGNHTVKEIKELLVKQKNKCVNCLVSFKRIGYHIDHIVALANGGRNDIFNIQLLCPQCNRRKNSKDPLVFARENGRLL